MKRTELTKLLSASARRKPRARALVPRSVAPARVPTACQLSLTYPAIPRRFFCCFAPRQKNRNEPKTSRAKRQHLNSGRDCSGSFFSSSDTSCDGNHFLASSVSLKRILSASTGVIVDTSILRSRSRNRSPALVNNVICRGWSPAADAHGCQASATLIPAALESRENGFGMVNHRRRQAG